MWLSQRKKLKILTEKRMVTDKNGNQSTRPKWLPIKDSVKESLRLFAKSTGATFVVDSSARGYQALLHTFEIRDKLMHPKDVFALGVLDTDVKDAEVAIAWLNQVWTETFDACHAHTSANIQRALAAMAKAKEKQTGRAADHQNAT
jgi:hypothetical protein